MTQLDLPLNGGVDEISPVNKIPLKNALDMENFRISNDATRVEKRLGLEELNEFIGQRVYGHSTYYNEDGDYCQLVVTDVAIWRKTGGGAWTSIHTFSSGVAHPVIPIQIQGKQFVIHENDSRMVHHDKNSYQIGITAPTSIPSSTTETSSEDTAIIEDEFSYADTPALDAVWTDADNSNGASTIASFQSANRLKMTASSCSSTSYAKRTKQFTEALGSKYSVEMRVYFDALGGVKNSRDLQLLIYNGETLFQPYFMKGGLAVFDSNGTQHTLTTKVAIDEWETWKFTIDATDSSSMIIVAFKDNIQVGTATINNASTAYSDYAEIVQNAKKTGSDVPLTYIDSFKILAEGKTSPATAGQYRYAVSYVRGGNFGCESNPTKSVIGSHTFSGGGLDDLTIGGTYTYSENKTFRIQIDGTGTPDTFKWSEDGGTTWSSKQIDITDLNYLPYGITLTFGATTGHTSGNYWEFTASVCIAAPVKESVVLTDIPVSSDPQVTAKNIYRTVRYGTEFFWLATISNDQTGFTDSIPDMALGELMAEDHDPIPNGKFSAWWDERLWVSGDDVVYYSDIQIPEHFSEATRYITVQRGDMSDEITGLVPYKDALYVFRKKSVYAIQKNALGYGLFLVTSDIGCVSPYTIINVNNMLMFRSYRGIEYYNGADIMPIELSIPLTRTMKTIDETKNDEFCAVHFPEKREVWFCFLTFTAVFHYLANAWYFFSFYKTPSCLVPCYDDSESPVIRMGTTDGFLLLCESTYLDASANIVAVYRKPWVESEQVADIRRVGCEYEIPAAKALTVNIYVNFDKDVQRTAQFVGETISATDIEFRRPQMDFAELGQRAKYVSVEFVNGEDLGGDLKINEVTLFLRDRATKGKVYGD